MLRSIRPISHHCPCSPSKGSLSKMGSEKRVKCTQGALVSDPIFDPQPLGENGSDVIGDRRKRMNRPLPPTNQSNPSSTASVSSLEHSGSSKSDAQNTANIRYIQRLYQLNRIDRLRRRYGWRRSSPVRRGRRPLWYRCTVKGCVDVAPGKRGLYDE